VEKAFFKVMGEKVVTTGSLVNLVVKVRVIPPGSLNVPEVKPSDLEDIDPEEGDIDALLGRKSKNKVAKLLDGDSETATGETPLQPHLAYAPYFARDHSPRWHIFLADRKSGKVAVPPTSFSTFTKPLLDGAGHPTFNMQTFKMQFQAPGKANRYSFVMHLICDSYIGMDSSLDVVLQVEDSSLAAKMSADDEISEPDEDSLAGQVNALKSGGLGGSGAPRRPIKKKPVVEDSSDDESDTDGEAGDATSDTDTNTDTDGE